MKSIFYLSGIIPIPESVTVVSRIQFFSSFIYSSLLNRSIWLLLFLIRELSLSTFKGKQFSSIIITPFFLLYLTAFYIMLKSMSQYFTLSIFKSNQEFWFLAMKTYIFCLLICQLNGYNTFLISYSGYFQLPISSINSFFFIFILYIWFWLQYHISCPEFLIAWITE